jgi:hypothetical protein
VAGASHEGIGDIQKAHRNRATAQRAGNHSTPSRPASAAAVFFRTPAANPEPPPAIRFPLPRIGRPLPATSFPVPRPGQFCPQFESVRRVFERLCRQFFRLCRNLRGLAANPPPPAAIYNLLPQSKLYEIATKKRKMRKENPHPSYRTPSPIGWEKDGVRGFLTINHQLQTIN